MVEGPPMNFCLGPQQSSRIAIGYITCHNILCASSFTYRGPYRAGNDP